MILLYYGGDLYEKNKIKIMARSINSIVSYYLRYLNNYLNLMIC